MTSIHLPHDWFARPLPDNVLIGPRSWCYSSFAFIHYRSRRPRGVCIGHDTGIYNGTFFDLGPNGEVEIGDYCTMVGAIISTNQRIVVGNYAMFAHEVVLADDAAMVPWSGDDQPANVGPIAESIVVGENAWIGTRAVLLRGAWIGEGAIVAAGTVINSIVPPRTIVAGNPARIVRPAPKR
jgi:acetyltransferase-like isoleucine patch superfamily enzyme